MTTLQEQFEKDFPDKGVEEIYISREYEDTNFTNYDLDLREYKNLDELHCSNNKITSISNLPNSLTSLYCYINNLTSLPQLPNSLTYLNCYNNNIQPTDIEIFSKLVNLKELKIGTVEDGLKKGKRNKFYGSLKSYQNLTKLEMICIEATDVNEGLEYLPFSLAQNTKGGSYHVIDCSPHNTNAKCSAIQDQLRPFNYDLEAWQLAHPEKMLISHPDYFTNYHSKDKWIKALADKITNTQAELQTAKANEADKLSKIARLETTIQELTQAKVQISQQTQTEFSTQNKSTQTDLSGSDYEQQQKENQELKEQIDKWEKEDKKKTLYQKFVEKYGKK